MVFIKCTACDTDNVSNSRYCKNCGKELPKAVEETKIETLLPKEKKPNKKVLLSVIASAFGAFIVYFAIQFLFFSKPSFDQVMMAAASEINKNCPFMVDNATRLDNALALPNKIFQYNYTLVNLTKADIQVEELKKFIEPTILNNVKTNPQMKFCRDNKATVVYYYKDKDGVFVYEYKLTPEMYE